MDLKAGVLVDVCAALAVGDSNKAKRTLQERYPFVPVEKIARRYSEREPMKLLIRDGFIDRYTGNREWLARGGVMLPIYQREAMWLSFDAAEPAALQVGVGKVCAVSGLPWIEHLVKDPQNYVVLPDQPWLDGINAGGGSSASSLPSRSDREPQSRDR